MGQRAAARQHVQMTGTTALAMVTVEVVHVQTIFDLHTKRRHRVLQLVHVLRAACASRRANGGQARQQLPCDPHSRFNDMKLNQLTAARMMLARMMFAHACMNAKAEYELGIRHVLRHCRRIQSLEHAA